MLLRTIGRIRLSFVSIRIIRNVSGITVIYFFFKYIRTLLIRLPTDATKTNSIRPVNQASVDRCCVSLEKDCFILGCLMLISGLRRLTIELCAVLIQLFVGVPSSDRVVTFAVGFPVIRS